MRHFERGSRIAREALSVTATAAVAAWALWHASAALAPTVALAGIAGVITFALSFRVPLAPARNRSVATGLVLVAIAVVVASQAEAGGTRTGFLVVSGAVLFCAAEVAERSLSYPSHVEHRPGVERWGQAWVLGVAVGSAALSYGAISTRGLLANGGPAALAAGTAAALLVAVLTTLVVRARTRTAA
jgi:hypothetical protein